MFVKHWKNRSIKKQIDRLLARQAYPFRPGVIHTVGIIYDASVNSSPKQLIEKLGSLGMRPNQIKSIGLLPDDTPNPNSWDSFFTAKDFGWNGVHHNPALKAFSDDDFDLLISYFENDSWPLIMATALSKANFKLGFIPSQEKSFDLIIDVKISQTDLLVAEIKKYLTQLNKLPNGRY